MNMEPNWFSTFKNNDNIEEGISEEFINNYFYLNKPFKTLRKVHTTMTKDCNFYGPINIEDIAKKNGLDKSKIDKQIINDELFFVDTEELKTIDDTTKSCVSSILTILQIASIKILYLPYIDNEKLEDVVKIQNYQIY